MYKKKYASAQLRTLFKQMKKTLQLSSQLKQKTAMLK